jgi:hypothetical protein
MINVHYKEVGKMWYGAALKGEEIIATAFSSSEEEVLWGLLESLPYNVPFQMVEKPRHFSIELLKIMTAIF